MNTEIDTVNEIIQAELDETLKATSKMRTPDEILEEAHNLYSDERALEHWRELFFAEQKIRDETEDIASKHRKALQQVNGKLRRAKVKMQGIKHYSDVLFLYLHAQSVSVGENTIAFNVARVALYLLRDITNRIDIPDVEDCEIDDIPF